LPGIHENPCGGPCKIGSAARSIDQEEAVREVRYFDPHLVVEDAELASGCSRRAIDISGDEIGRQLLRLCRSASRNDKADQAKQARPGQGSRPSQE
jgi:hypothetical protein